MREQTIEIKSFGHSKINYNLCLHGVMVEWICESNKMKRKLNELLPPKRSPIKRSQNDIIQKKLETIEDDEKYLRIFP